MKKFAFLFFIAIILGLSACSKSWSIPAQSPTPISSQTSALSPSPSLSVRQQNEAIEEDANEEYYEGKDYWSSVDSNLQELNTDSVYWVPKGKSYHATKDCCALLKSSQIVNGTLKEASENGKTDPCSKCVGD